MKKGADNLGLFGYFCKKTEEMRHPFLLFAVFFSILACGRKAPEPDSLSFDSAAGDDMTLSLPDGRVVEFTAYEDIYYVSDVTDSLHQSMNIYVPVDAAPDSPILFRTYFGGYMACSAARPQEGDATGRALAEGYVVVIPGCRGRTDRYEKLFTDGATASICDLKAAVRYLRHFDDLIPGDSEKIITDGASAGGAMSALLGATGNHPFYADRLDAMGAARERDDVFASICYCPIIDLDHSGMAYEWFYGGTSSRRALPEGKRAESALLARNYPAYFDSLGLVRPDGEPLRTDNLREYITDLLIRSAQKAKDAGADFPDGIGLSFSGGPRSRFVPPVNGGAFPPRPSPAKRVGEYIIGLDLDSYLDYVERTEPLKGVPDLDTTRLDGSPLQCLAAIEGFDVTDDLLGRIRMMNPLGFIGDPEADVAPHWYIRHGARDRDTSFPVPVILERKLSALGKDVDFAFAWNRPHSGDYALDELFSWAASLPD